MKIFRHFILVTFILITAASASDCNASHFDFTSTYTLGKQDQLNKTFTMIQQKITTLNNVSYSSSAFVTFIIYNVNPTFYYRDTKQKAIIRGNNTLIVDGGFLEVDFTFNWTTKEMIPKSGWASAQGLSDQIIFSKKIAIDNGFYVYELLEVFPLTFWPKDNAFKLTRVDPPSTSQQNKAILVKMLNNLDPLPDVKAQLQTEIQKYYKYYLNTSLHDEHQPIGTQFDYNWIPGNGKPNVTIPFERKPLTVDIQKAGLLLTFAASIQNDTNWKCGTRKVPDIPFDSSLYGGTQEYISFDFYQNVVRWAINKGLLNTQLKKQNWGGRMFQFFAGDLYEVFPLVQTRYYANSVVQGTCNATDSRLKIQKNEADSFYVSINYDCQLFVVKDRISSFIIDLKLSVYGDPKASYLDFKIRNHSQNITFTQVGQFKLENKQLAEAMIQSSLNRIYEGLIFGSGWPMSPPRDYPHFMTQINYTVVYDSSHMFPTTVI